MTLGRRIGIAGLLSHILIASCGGEDIDQGGADSLWEKIHEEDYRSWARPPDWPARQPTVRAHGQTADVYISPEVTNALAESGLMAWPEGSVLVKDSYDGDDLSLIAAMEKQGERWFFAEWGGDGKAKFAGYPDVCVRCHEAGDDFVLTAALP